MPTLNPRQWLVGGADYLLSNRLLLVIGDSPRGQLGQGIGQARIHTGFHRFTEVDRIFHTKYTF